MPQRTVETLKPAMMTSEFQLSLRLRLVHGLLSAGHDKLTTGCLSEMTRVAEVAVPEQMLPTDWNRCENIPKSTPSSPNCK